ncbi:MAG TPA: hypothetical protein DCM62_07710 [Bacteroidales bacterium]|nr:hypothetical protein [Bacteroidales bacterium]
MVDPNQYKQIEIPYHQGGTIAGSVSMLRNGESVGVGGFRIILESAAIGFKSILRTFSDGSFYLMDLPPGIYTLHADSLQLGFLGATQEKPVMFEIKSTPDGDFVEGLEIILHSTLPALANIRYKDAVVANLPTKTQQPEQIAHYIDEPTMGDDHIQVLHDRVFIAGIQQQNQEIVIQAGAFRLRTHAARLQAQIETLTELPVFVLLENGLSRIIIFGFESVEHALHLQRILTEQEIPSFLRLSTTNNLPRVQIPEQETTVPALRADTLVIVQDRIQITNFRGRIEEISLQAGAFSILANAEKFHAHIETLIDTSVLTQKEDSLSKVLIYGFESVDHALRIQNVLTQNGIPSFFRLASNQHPPNRQLQLHEIAVPHQYTEDEVNAPITINITNLTNRIQEVVMQVGAFVNRTNAEKLHTRIQHLTGLPVTILLDNALHKVLISGFESVDQAISVQNYLTQQGFSSFFTLSSEFNLP